VKLGHVAIDGTKMAAGASKHKAMSCGRMGEAEKKLWNGPLMSEKALVAASNRAKEAPHNRRVLTHPAIGHPPPVRPPIRVPMAFTWLHSSTSRRRSFERESLHAHGRSLRAMSAALTREGYVSRSGPFFAVQVVHMLARVEQLAAARHRMSAATSRLSKTAIKSRLAPAYPPKNFVEDEFLVITAARR
jgi:hypothetical protein